LRRNCLLKHFIEEKMHRTGKRGLTRKQMLLDDIKGTRRPWKLKEEALDRTVWRTRFGGDYFPVVRMRDDEAICLSLSSSDSVQWSIVYMATIVCACNTTAMCLAWRCVLHFVCSLKSDVCCRVGIVRVE
jgi:hypothetical protein